MKPGPVIAVIDPTPVPAEDCRAAAAVLAAWRAGGVPARGLRLVAARDADFPRGAREFVTADRRPMPNGCFWLERATGGVWLPPMSETPLSGPVVLAAASEADLPEGVDLVLRRDEIPLVVDEFGRPWLEGPVPGLPEAIPQARPIPRGAALRICVIGFDDHLRRVNPTVIARLADAADAGGFRLEISTVPAETVVALGIPSGIDGLVLPGGGDMGQVEALVRGAQDAWETDLPLLGLCLGMQGMTLAALRRGGWPDANLEEIVGPGPGNSRNGFVRMKDAGGNDRDRKGDATLVPAPGSRLAALLGGPVAVRMHHRFCMNPEGYGVAAAAGQLATAFDPLGVVEAVEFPGRRFQIGLQGHPEISVSPGLEGLWRGFLRACAERAATATAAR
ncbi:glutamine amidotransferase-related protein [Pseudogemmobacter sonorensis]|uniref:glutamine amidotransferase-related protein n=1 Tax=Pseudogemmobacter sonorensis TaxID=2989681 RepID=UPI00369C9389